MGHDRRVCKLAGEWRAAGPPLTPIRGKGVFRRFKQIAFEGGNVELSRRWLWCGKRHKRGPIVRWLEDNNIEPQWDRDIFQAPPLPGK